MRKNQNTSSLLLEYQRATKFSYSKLILASIFFAFTIMTQAQGIPRNNHHEKYAVMFVDPSMTTHERRLMRVVMEQDRDWYIDLGYNVYEVDANVDTISSAILDGRVKSIAYYGHGGCETPTIANWDQNQWKGKIKKELVKRYKSKEYSYSDQDADNLAISQSQNFGLRDVVNRSCGSLYNTSLADLFVSPGGSYYGSLAKYYGFFPLSYFSEDNDWTISEYISQGTSNYSPLPTSSVNNTGDSSFNCPDLNPEPGNTSIQIFPKPKVPKNKPIENMLPKGTYVKCRYHYPNEMGKEILGSKIGYRDNKKVIAEYFDSRNFLSKRIEYDGDGKKSEVTNFYDTGKPSSYSTYNSSGTRLTYKAWYKDGRAK